MIIFLVILTTSLRCISLGDPYLGNFASYQCYSASIARHYVRENFSDIFNPKIDILVNGKPGLHMQYFPISSLVAALGQKFIGGSLEVWGRLQAILFSSLALLCIYGIARRLFTESIALTSALLWSVLPVSVIYGQSFMPEMAGLSFAVLSIWLALRQKCLLSALFAGIAIMTRMNTIYVLVPLLMLIPWRKWAYLAWGSLIPILWYGHTITQAKYNASVSHFWMLQGANQSFGPDFLLALGKYLVTVDFTPLGFILLFFGLKGLPKWIYGWGISVLVILCLMPQKVIDHNFYTLHLLPVGCMAIAKNFNSWKIPALILLSVIWWWNPVTKIDPGNKYVLEAARLVQEQVPKDDKIIASSGSSPCLLYYCDREGWDFMIKRPEEVPYVQKFRWRFEKNIDELLQAYKDAEKWKEQLKSEGAKWFTWAEQGGYGFVEMK